MTTEARPLAALALLAVFGAYLALLQLHVPMFADDLCRAHERMSLANAVDAAIGEYRRWSGRFPVMVLNHLVFSGEGHGMVVLAVLNGLFLFLAGAALLMVFGGVGGLVFVVVFLSLAWFATANFGEAVLWKTGSIQFFWGALLATACALPWIRAGSAKSFAARPVAACAWLVACLLGGMWLENLSVAVVVVAGAALLASRFGGMPRWPGLLKAGYGLWLVGTLVLLAAPGNYARVDAVGTVEPLPARLAGITSQLLAHLDPLILLSVIAFLAVALVRRPPDLARRACTAAALAAIGVLAAYATIGAPVVVFTGRVAFVSQWFFVLAALALFPRELFQPGWHPPLRRAALVACALVAVMLVVDARTIYRVYERIDRQEAERHALITAARQRGQLAVKLPPLRFTERWTTHGREINRGRRFARDITIDARHFLNQCFARYHGLEKVAL